MIFAEMIFSQDYSELHFELVEYLSLKFEKIEHGLQGDSWIWILNKDDKVAIDTFYSMQHQIKSSNKTNKLVNSVIEHLQQKYQLKTYPKPEFEPHE
jgi:hypothetical protein